LQIGGPLYMNSLLLGDGTTNTGLSRGSNGALLCRSVEARLIEGGLNMVVIWLPRSIKKSTLD